MEARIGWLPLILLLGLGVTVTACTTHGERSSGVGPLFGPVMSPDDLLARQPRQGGSGSVGESARARAAVYLGDQAAGYENTGQPISVASGEYSLNFENADLKEVVQAILGSALGVSYTMAPEVTGTATIFTARPLGRDDLLLALERALQMNGAALVKTGQSYSIVEQSSAVAGRADAGGTAPGFGISILPLRHVSTDNVMRLVDGFGTRPGSLRVEKARNLLIIVGSSADRRAATETALSFDVDWMRDQSVAILPLQRAQAAAIIPELQRIFKAEEEGIGADLVQFTRMSRLNAVLVVSQKPELIARARTWVSRLDSSDPGLDSKVHVYRVKYRNAQKLADLLNQVFTSAGGTPEPAAASSGRLSASAATAFDDSRSDRVRDDEAAMGSPDATLEQPIPANLGLTASVQLRIRADASDNSLVIYADRDKTREILTALHQIDVPQIQVAINVTMAEVRLNDDLRYGVQYFLKSGNKNGSLGLFNSVTNNIGRELPGFNFLFGSEQSPDVIIDAFDSITDVQVLSSPSLVVLDNEIAKFQVGDQIPIVTRTVTSVQDADAPVSNEVEYRDTGVILKVKPRVSENGVVSMEIEQEISSVAAGAASLTPTISNRLVSSSISVVDGQTVLLGGLISEQSEGENSGIPGLHRLKGIGGLFGRKGRANSRTELIILIRPSVIHESQDAQHVAEDLRARMWGLGSTRAR